MRGKSKTVVIQVGNCKCPDGGVKPAERFWLDDLRIEIVLHECSRLESAAEIEPRLRDHFGVIAVHPVPHKTENIPEFVLGQAAIVMVILDNNRCILISELPYSTKIRRTADFHLLNCIVLYEGLRVVFVVT